MTSPNGDIGFQDNGKATAVSESNKMKPPADLQNTSQAKDSLQVPKGRRFHRKRRHSTSEDFNGNGSKKHRRQPSGHHKKGPAGDIILPTKFLLGGNISDPLNLNSLLDEKVNKALNAITPTSSPLPPRSSTVHIVIPPDMTDPLGLNESGESPPSEQNGFEKAANDSENMETAKGGGKKKRKRRKSQHEKMFLVEAQSGEMVEKDDKGDVSTTSVVSTEKAGKLKKTVPQALNLQGQNNMSDVLSVNVSQVRFIIFLWKQSLFRNRMKPKMT